MEHNGDDALAENARPFQLDAGPRAVLLLHGWLGLPGELRPLGEFLASRGYSVAAPLLAGHGAHPEALHTVRWPAWYASAVAAHAALAERYGRVAVVGYSLGGLLALHLAARTPVAGVVTLAAAIEPAGGWPLRLLGVGRYALPWLYPFRKSDFADPQLRADLEQKMGVVDWNDPAMLAQLRKTIRISTHSIYEVVQLGRQVRRDLPRITAPVLVTQGRLDTTVLPRSGEQIYAGLGTVDKELAWYERSGHLLPNDVERAALWQRIAAWLEPRTGQAEAPPAAGSASA